MKLLSWTMLAGLSFFTNQALRAADVSTDKFDYQPGDVVVITGNPGRTPEDHRVRMVTIKRPSDGFGWGGRPGQTFD